MSSYGVVIEKKVLGSLKRIPNPHKQDIFKKLNRLKGYSTRTRNVKKLKGCKNGYRMRIGDYRVLFVKEEESKTIKIYTIGHRKDVYRG